MVRREARAVVLHTVQGSRDGTEAGCTHRWQIDSPAGEAQVRGVCKNCGLMRLYWAAGPPIVDKLAFNTKSRPSERMFARRKGEPPKPREEDQINTFCHCGRNFNNRGGLALHQRKCTKPEQRGEVA